MKIKTLIFALIAMTLLVPCTMKAQTLTLLSGAPFGTSATTSLGFDTTNGVLLTSGIYSGNAVLTGSELDSGSKMLWDPAKAAFVGGYFNSSLLDANIGAYSFSFGQNNIASGGNSMAFGNRNTVTASGYFSAAMGNQNTVSGSGSLALGVSNLVSGSNTLTSGVFNTVSGSNAVSFGVLNNAFGNFSFVQGYMATAAAYGEAVFGQYNGLPSSAPTVSTTKWVATDPLLELGNGTNPVATSDALVVYKNGNAVFAPPAGTTQTAGTPSCTVTAPGFVTTTSSGDIPMYTGN